MLRWVVSAAWALVFGMGAGTGMTSAADIKVMASAAIREAYLELVPAFEKQSGHKVVTIWSGTTEVSRRIGGGEVVDLVIASAPTIEKLTADGKVVGSRVDLAK